MNSYLDFIKDKDFEKSVDYVLKGYYEKKSIEKEKHAKNVVDMLIKDKNTIDEFKLVFDLFGDETHLNDWKMSEIVRQTDKTVNNYIGEFHQMVLGSIKGWTNLGTGDETGVDLKKDDNSIFIELKNKYNAMNSSSQSECRRKLENIVEKYPDSTAYWGFIINKKYKPVCEIWEYTYPKTVELKKDSRILKASGDEIYKLVTGDPNSLKKTFEALQIILNEKIDGYHLSSEDKKSLQEFSNHVFLESR
ncbi:Eco47II family restriction endonuclease [Methanobrevibacter curvatus]|uniref:Eco47II restriction endonuclease n=1 Tax=Methanobrevibacter curvatus TaxID=49547 RepID=A0A165Z901_9EURY|nr:Eco47II family restriction endonuclease [Methanobrevibacter curvatus]KZX10411.1 Eco47II restriction endonuclease [Methanobrevibacter curvatus]